MVILFSTTSCRAQAPHEKITADTQIGYLQMPTAVADYPNGIGNTWELNNIKFSMVATCANVFWHSIIFNAASHWGSHHSQQMLDQVADHLLSISAQ